jgi:hypothetical protein
MVGAVSFCYRLISLVIPDSVVWQPVVKNARRYFHSLSALQSVEQAWRLLRRFVNVYPNLADETRRPIFVCIVDAKESPDLHLFKRRGAR